MRLRVFVLSLALLAIPSVAMAALCATYGGDAYDACHNGQVIDPATGAP